MEEIEKRRKWLKTALKENMGDEERMEEILLLACRGGFSDVANETEQALDEIRELREEVQEEEEE